jgi:hypothetical protein
MLKDRIQIDWHKSVLLVLVAFGLIFSWSALRIAYELLDPGWKVLKTGDYPPHSFNRRYVPIQFLFAILPVWIRCSIMAGLGSWSLACSCNLIWRMFPDHALYELGPIGVNRRWLTGTKYIAWTNVSSIQFTDTTRGLVINGNPRKRYFSHDIASIEIPFKQFGISPHQMLEFIRKQRPDICSGIRSPTSKTEAM